MTPLVATLIILLITIVAFISGKVSFVVISPFIIISLILTGVLKPADALSGFSNTSVIMFIGMFVVGAALTKTSLLDRMQKIVEKYKDNPRMLVTISCVVAGLVGVLTSTTAAAAIMLPVLVGIANEIGFSRSRLLFPAMMVAGTATGMTFLGQGASNMTWSDIMMKAGGKIPFTIWDFTIARFPIVIIALVYMITIGYKLLPNTPNEQFEDYGSTSKNTKSSLALSAGKEKIALIICGLTILAMFFADFMHIDMFVITSIGAVMLIATGVLKEKEAINAIHWPTVLLFVGVLPLSTALQKSGAGKVVADFMINMLGNTTNPYIIIFFFILVPLILTQVMSDLATIAIFVPLASTVAIRIGIDPRAAVMATLIASCINTLTPMANPAQTMIMGPGGYTMKDYMKCGLPITIIIVIASVIILPILFPLYS